MFSQPLIQTCRQMSGPAYPKNTTHFVVVKLVAYRDGLRELVSTYQTHLLPFFDNYVKEVYTLGTSLANIAELEPKAEQDKRAGVHLYSSNVFGALFPGTATTQDVAVAWHYAVTELESLDNRGLCAHVRILYRTGCMYPYEALVRSFTVAVAEDNILHPVRAISKRVRVWCADLRADGGASNVLVDGRLTVGNFPKRSRMTEFCDHVHPVSDLSLCVMDGVCADERKRLIKWTERANPNLTENEKQVMLSTFRPVSATDDELYDEIICRYLGLDDDLAEILKHSVRECRRVLVLMKPFLLTMLPAGVQLYSIRAIRDEVIKVIATMDFNEELGEMMYAMVFNLFFMLTVGEVEWKEHADRFDYVRMLRVLKSLGIDLCLNGPICHMVICFILRCKVGQGWSCSGFEFIEEGDLVFDKLMENYYSPGFITEAVGVFVFGPTGDSDNEFDMLECSDEDSIFEDEDAYEDDDADMEE